MDCERKYGAGLLAFLAACAILPARAQEIPIDVQALKAAVLTETNAYRGSKKVPELRANAALNAAAATYAMFLAQRDAGGHTADGRNPSRRASAEGYKWCFVAENVWGGWRKPDPMMVDEVARKSMDGWKKSPGHNANLLDKRTRDIGIGAAAWRQADGREVFRVVQVFGDECPGKPRPAPPVGELIDAARRAIW